MKKFYLFAMLLTVCISLLGVGCSDSDEDVVLPSAVVLEMQSVDVPAEGGVVQVGYSIENPIEGVSLSCRSDAEWITSIEVSGAAIAVSVQQNVSAEPRTASILLDYAEQVGIASLEVKQAAAPDENAAFKMEVKNPTESSLTISITPTDKEMIYITRTIDAEDYIALGGVDGVVRSDIDELVAFAEEVMVTPQELLPDFSDKGDIHDQVMGGLPSGVKFVTYVYGINPETLERTTDLLALEAATLPVEKNQVKFAIEATPDSNYINVKITPIDYEDYYFANVVEVPQDMTDREIEKKIAADWAEMRYIYTDAFGLTFEEIPAELCLVGEFVSRVEMEAEKRYVVYAFTINDQALLNSEVAFMTVETGSVAASDNQIKIEVSDLKAYSAFVTITPSNNDAYAVAAWGAAELEGFTDEELKAGLLEEVGGTMNGVIEAPLEGLTPNTEYRIFAFGYQGGVMTTELFEKRFKTPEAVLATVEAELNYGRYYDAYAVGALDEQYFEHAIQATVFAPIDFVKYEGEAFYSAFLPATVAEELSDDEIKSMVIASYYPTNTDVPYAILSVIYGDSKVGVAFSMDAAGNYSKLYRGEVLCPTELGVGDPRELIENYPWPSNAPSGSDAVESPLAKKQPSAVLLKRSFNSHSVELMRRHAAQREALDLQKLSPSRRALIEAQLF